jgi:hypothetical protein
MEKTKIMCRRAIAFLKNTFIKKNKPTLNTGEWIIVLVAFFVIGFPVLYFQSGVNSLGDGKLKYSGNFDLQTPSSDEVVSFVGKTVYEPIDTTEWDTYQNPWYGFEIKHPDSWSGIRYKTATTKKHAMRQYMSFERMP